MNESPLSPRYDASLVERRWYAAWEQAGLFAPDPDPSKPRTTLTIPPPNITGSLHMGHALCYPLQDVVGRFRRLRGDSVLIVPGQDHAGIATQSVVEKQLRKEGTSGAEIGRDAFVRRVWEWRKESGDTILNQLRRLGCAFDWTRLRFTLDDAYAEAVLRVFIDWFERGFIFRGQRVVNWDPVLQTSVSDIETERRLVRGKLYYVRYAYADGSGHLVIATTRPETILADVAVAVHPSDDRYKTVVGRTVILPLLGREIPVIADIYPDPEFGTGAVKITPAHDANDYAVGQRHDLPMPVLLDARARITDEGGPYAGLDRVEARKRIVADLEAAGLLEKVEDHEIALTVSERSGEPIEPLLSEQWFADQPKLAQPVLDAMRAGRIRFTPDRYERIFVEWLENIREWNLSRQLWWGHRIPVYYTEDGEAFAGLNWEDAQSKAGDKKIVRQDEDVLDTWFSSGLWPFAVLGWPEQTPELAERYPTSVLVTDRNIINLWVARMAMMSLDLLHEIPFHDVFIYATVLTEDGRRMSKSLGTGVDPMGVIETFGADAMRWTLLSQTGSNQDIRYSDKKTEDARNFCNKIWNATRFVLLHTPDGKPDAPGDLEPTDKWLLSRLVAAERAVRDAYESYDLQVAAQHLYKFWWSELCDWYIEVSKSRLVDPQSRTAPQWVLLTAIEAFVAMLHPLMPFLTEEVYSHLPLKDKAPFLMAAKWPDLPDSFADPAAEADVERAFEVTRALRALRSEVDLPAMKVVPVAHVVGDLRGGERIVQTQAWIETLRTEPPEEPEKALSTSLEGIDLWLPLAGLVDTEREAARLAKEQEKLESELAKLEGRLANPQFLERAKPEVVERERAAAADLRERLAKLEARKALLG